MHIVLEAVADHWNEHGLSAKYRQNLEILVEGCVDNLQELESALSKHESLERKKKLDLTRLKWAAKSLAPIRTSLVNSATLLAMFHETVT